VRIEAAVDDGADAVMTTFGVAKRYREQLTDRIPTILRLDGGPSLYREDWLAHTEWSLLHSVEDALFGECVRVGLPLMVEALPCPSERIPNPKAPEAMASAARLGFEHGADLVKTYYTEDFRQVTGNCPGPVLIAGGPKTQTGEETLQVVHDAAEAGAAGAVFGRNVWQSDDPRGTIRALKSVIHDGLPVAEALAESGVM
jgi:DhnA family fructose-bisphosphate aldolase class Ia